MFAKQESGSPPYRAGTPVPRSAKYAGLHEGHPLPFQLMHLFGGELFPGCSQCGESVTYVEVVRARRRDRPLAARSSAPLHAV